MTTKPRSNHRRRSSCATTILSILLSLVPAARAVEFGKRSVSGGYWHNDLRVTNTTAGMLSLVSGTAITGAAAGDFEVRELVSGPVEPGEDLVVRVTFNPSAAGPRTAQLAVVTDHPGVER